MGAAQNQGKIVDINLQHPHIKNCKTLTTSTGNWLLTSTSVQLTTYKQWKSQLESLKSKLQAENFLFLPVKDQFEDGGVCSTSGQLTLQYEYYPRLLSTEINSRKKDEHKFTQGELWYLLYALIFAKLDLSQNNSELGQIHPRNIFLNVEGKVKIACQKSWPNFLSSFKMAILQQQCGYLSPEDFQRLRLGAMDNLVNTESQIFEIGLVLLSSASLQIQQGLFSMRQKQFEHSLFASRLQTFQKDSAYSEIHRAIVSNLLQQQPTLRMSLQELCQFLSKHQKNILAKKPLLIDNVNKKLQLTINNMLKNTHQNSQTNEQNPQDNHLNKPNDHQSQNRITPPQNSQVITSQTAQIVQKRQVMPPLRFSNASQQNLPKMPQQKAPISQKNIIISPHQNNSQKNIQPPQHHNIPNIPQNNFQITPKKYPPTQPNKVQIKFQNKQQIIQNGQNVAVNSQNHILVLPKQPKQPKVLLQDTSKNMGNNFAGRESRNSREKIMNFINFQSKQAQQMTPERKSIQQHSNTNIQPNQQQRIFSERNTQKPPINRPNSRETMQPPQIFSQQNILSKPPTNSSNIHLPNQFHQKVFSESNIPQPPRNRSNSRETIQPQQRIFSEQNIQQKLAINMPNSRQIMQPQPRISERNNTQKCLINEQFVNPKIAQYQQMPLSEKNSIVQQSSIIISHQPRQEFANFTPQPINYQHKINPPPMKPMNPEPTWTTIQRTYPQTANLIIRKSQPTIQSPYKFKPFDLIQKKQSVQNTYQPPQQYVHKSYNQTPLTDSPRTETRRYQQDTFRVKNLEERKVPEVTLNPSETEIWKGQDLYIANKLNESIFSKGINIKDSREQIQDQVPSKNIQVIENRELPLFNNQQNLPIIFNESPNIADKIHAQIQSNSLALAKKNDISQEAPVLQFEENKPLLIEQFKQPEHQQNQQQIKLNIEVDQAVSQSQPTIKQAKQSSVITAQKDSKIYLDLGDKLKPQVKVWGMNKGHIKSQEVVQEIKQLKPQAKNDIPSIPINRQKQQQPLKRQANDQSAIRDQHNILILQSIGPSQQLINSNQQSGIQQLNSEMEQVLQFHTYADIKTDGNFDQCWNELVTLLRDPSDYSSIINPDKVMIKARGQQWALKVGPAIVDIFFNIEEGKVLLKNYEYSRCEGVILGGVFKDEQKCHRIWFNSAYYYKGQKYPPKQLIDECLLKCKQNISKIPK